MFGNGDEGILSGGGISHELERIDVVFYMGRGVFIRRENMKWN